MTASKLIILVLASVLAPALTHAQIGDYKKIADISSSNLYQVNVEEDLIYGVGKTDYRRLNASGTYDDVTEKNLELDLFVPSTPVSIGKRAVLILLPPGGRSGCRNVSENLIDSVNGCTQQTIVTGDRVDQEGLNYNHLNNNRARQYAEKGLVVASLNTRYEYEHSTFNDDGSNRWFRTPDGTADSENSRRLLTRLSAHLEFLVTDVKRAVRWLTANADQYNIDPNYIFIDGASGAAKMASLATITDETQLIVDDPANIDVAFERAHNNWDIRDSTPGIKGAILRSGDMNGLFHTDLMDTMPDNADAFMLWTGTADASILHGVSEVLEDKCEILGTCFTQLYSLPNRTHGNTGSATFPHTVINDTLSPNHIYDFIVNSIYRDTLNQPVISISQAQTSFSESSESAQITIERSGDTSAEIKFTVTADQMREVTIENGQQGAFDLLTKFVAKSSNSDGLLMYHESTGYAYEDAFGGNLRLHRDRVLLHESGRGDGEFTEISSADIEYHNIDFIGRTQTITIPSGQTSATFSVDIQNDDLFEDNECFKVRLLNAYGADIGNSMEVITIIDDDSANPQSNAVCGNPTYVADSSQPPITPYVSITPINNSVNEGASLILSIHSDVAVTEDVTVEYQTVGGTAKSSTGDYTFIRDLAVIPAGSDSVDISINTNVDSLAEGSESFAVRLNEVSAGSAIISSTDRATIVIGDDATDPPNISITPSINSVDEGASLILSIVSDEIVNEDIIFEYQTVGGDATSESRDYFFVQEVAVIPEGSDRVDISIQTRPDDLVEGSESFSVRLNEIRSGRALISPIDRATIRIYDALDNNEPPLPPARISITPTINNVDEGSSLILSVLSDVIVAEDVAVEYQTVGGIAKSSSGDYVYVKDTVVIPAGSDSVNIAIQTNSDTLDEGSENFAVRVNEVISGNAVLSSANRAAIRINDTVSLPFNISITPGIASVDEGASLILSIVSDEIVTEDIAVEFQTLGGDATSISNDYVFIQDIAVISAGSDRVDISIQIEEDSLVEGDEHFSVRLNGVSSGRALISSINSATITITDEVQPGDEPDPNDTGIADDIVCGEPDYSSRIDVGFFIWQDCDQSDEWIVRATAGGGDSIRYDAIFMSSAAFDFVDPFSFEGNDNAELLNLDTQIDVLMTMAINGQDGIQYSLPADSDLCLTLEDNNQIIYVGANREAFASPLNLRALGTICEQELPLLSVSDMSVTEEMGVAEVVVELNTASTEPISVSYTTQDDTAVSTQDYSVASGILEFPVNATNRTVSIPITTDNIGEAVETFKFAMSNPINAGLLNQVSQISIVDSQSVMCGRPSFSSSGDAGIFVWQDCGDSDQWYLRATAGGGAGVTFTGSLVSDVEITSHDEVSFEGNDSVNTSNNSKQLDFLVNVVGTGIDGLNINLHSGGSESCFDASVPVIVGRSNAVLTPPFNIYSFDPC